MTCANHPDRERVAFCQNCGKALCAECLRTVGTSVFCEPCLTARAAYQTAGAAAAPGEPSPGVAAILGFIPGVGAMYNGQYAKGLVHILIFAVLISLTNDVNDLFGLFIGGWVLYQVVEAHHTARARRDGTPLPNPFGLNDLEERLGFAKAWHGAPGVPYSGGPFQGAGPQPDPAQAAAPYPNAPYPYAAPASWGAPQDTYPSGVPPVPPYNQTPPYAPIPPIPPYGDPNHPYARRFPAGAVWLIALGVLFLLGNAGLFHVLRAKYLVPVILIGAGVYNFVRRMTDAGGSFENDGTAMYSARLAHAVSGSAFIVLIGVLFLINSLGVLSWSHSWPFFLIVAGVLMLLRRTSFGGYGYAQPPVYPYGAQQPPAPTEPPATPTTTAIVPTPRDNWGGK